MREAGESPLLNRITKRDRRPPGLGTSPNSRLPGRSTGDEESTAHQRNDDRRESRFTPSRGCWPCELAVSAREKGVKAGSGSGQSFSSPTSSVLDRLLWPGCGQEVRMVPIIQITKPQPTTIQTWREENCPGSGAPV